MIVEKLISDFAAWNGQRTRRALMKKYPGGLCGTVGPIYMTRGKVAGKVWGNPVYSGRVPEASMVFLHPEVYEVVYHARLGGHDDFVLSLLPWQLNRFEEGTAVTILEYGCIRHPLHYLAIGHSSTEIYPQKTEIFSERFDDVKSKGIN